MLTLLISAFLYIKPLEPSNHTIKLPTRYGADIWITNKSVNYSQNYLPNLATSLTCHADNLRKLLRTFWISTYLNNLNPTQIVWRLYWSHYLTNNATNLLLLFEQLNQFDRHVTKLVFNYCTASQELTNQINKEKLCQL